MNNPEFQKEWFAMERRDFIASGNTMKKIMNMTCDQVYRDRGLRWEKIQSIKTGSGRILYSLRLSKKHRAIVFRNDDFMIFVSLHPDHDSAYD